ncbi:hypothetical protein MRX96_026673 [Rhipicephalus microplus]
MATEEAVMPMDLPQLAPVTTPHPAAVPAGAETTVPVDVPPERIYEDDEDQVAEVMKPHQATAEPDREISGEDGRLQKVAVTGDIIASCDAGYECDAGVGDQ